MITEMILYSSYTTFTVLSRVIQRFAKQMHNFSDEFTKKAKTVIDIFLGFCYSNKRISSRRTDNEKKEYDP